MYKLFEKVPVIEGDRIILKRIEFEDADLLDELSKDSDIYRFLPTYLLEQEIDDKKELIDILYTKCLEEKSSLFLGIYLRDAEDAAGAAADAVPKSLFVTTTIQLSSSMHPACANRSVTTLRSPSPSIDTFSISILLYDFLHTKYIYNISQLNIQVLRQKH